MLPSLITTLNSFLQTAKKPLIVIVGATCSGKTELSLEIAKGFNGEIISADSRQIFRKLNIGTAKITAAEMQGIPHHGIDLCEPDGKFTVADFKRYALLKIGEILKRQKVPILVGGTGLYVNAVTQDFSIPQAPPHQEFRQSLAQFNNDELHAKLAKLDPAEAEKIHPHNRIYLERALEIMEITGKPKSAVIKKGESAFEVLIIGLELEREILYKKINRRVEQMFQQGFVEEVKSLLAAGYDFSSQAFNSVGYREIKAMLEGKLSRAETIALIQQKTRNYAKRQLTWWRNDERVRWIKS